MLSRALPAVDDALVRKLGDALEQLHELQRQHEDLERARGMVASIVERSYRSYARGVLAQRAEGLRQAESGFQAARTRARATAEALDAAVQVLEEAERTAARLEHDGAGATAEYEQLIGSSAYEAVGLIDDRARQRDEAADRERRARTAAEAATQRSTDAQAAAAAAARAPTGPVNVCGPWRLSSTWPSSTQGCRRPETRRPRSGRSPGVSPLDVRTSRRHGRWSRPRAGRVSALKTSPMAWPTPSERLRVPQRRSTR